MVVRTWSTQTPWSRDSCLLVHWVGICTESYQLPTQTPIRMYFLLTYGKFPKYRVVKWLYVPGARKRLEVWTLSFWHIELKFALKRIGFPCEYGVVFETSQDGVAERQEKYLGVENITIYIFLILMLRTWKLIPCITKHSNQTQLSTEIKVF